MKSSMVVALLFLSACASVPLSQEEREVRILRKSDPPAECKEIGKVHAPGMMSVTEEGRESDLKRATHKSGGDTVTVDNRDENNTVYGTAYKCK